MGMVSTKRGNTGETVLLVHSSSPAKLALTHCAQLGNCCHSHCTQIPWMCRLDVWLNV